MWRYIGTKLFFDQFLFEIPYLTLFFSVNSIIEGKNLQQIKDKLRQDLIPTFLVDCQVSSILLLYTCPVTYKLSFRCGLSPNSSTSATSPPTTKRYSWTRCASVGMLICPSCNTERNSRKPPLPHLSLSQQPHKPSQLATYGLYLFKCQVKARTNTLQWPQQSLSPKFSPPLLSCVLLRRAVLEATRV